MERHFERELEDLKNTLTAMATLVDRQLDNACDALFGGQLDVARRVIADDARVDAFDSRIDIQCQNLLALSQPVAIDLRLLMVALQINSQLERIGDIAVNLAQRAAPLQPHLKFVHQTRLGEMAQIARIMVHDALESFMTSDATEAGRVLATDDVVDNLERSLFSTLVEAMQNDHALVEAGSHMLILTHHIERMADHATNIAEGVIFLVEAKLVKHNAAEAGL